MHPIYQDTIAPEGTALYYSLRCCPSQSAELIQDVCRLSRQLEAVLYEVTEPSVARAKLAWWRSEIEKMLALETVQHPLLKRIQDQLSNLPGVLAQAGPWLGMAEAVEQDLARNRYDDWESLSSWLDLSGGCLAEVVGRVLLAQAGVGCLPAFQTYLQDLGRFCQYVKVIRNMPLAAMQNRIYIPAADLREVGVTARNVLENHDSPEMLALVKQQCERALVLYSSLKAKLTPENAAAAQKPLLPLLVRISLNASLIHKIHHKPQLVLKQRASLTPIRKLLLTHRIKRRALKFRR